MGLEQEDLLQLQLNIFLESFIESIDGGHYSISIFMAISNNFTIVTKEI
jgi:hypothetical protein